MMAAKQIALWGYGTYGRGMEMILCRMPKGHYEITAIFDQRFAELGPAAVTGLEIRDPATAGALYRQGLFEEVLIAVYDAGTKGRIEEILADAGIPRCVIGEKNTMRPPEHFPAWEEPEQLKWEGYTKYVFRDQYLEFLKHNQQFFVYGGDGNLNGAYWYDYQRDSDETLRIYRPDPGLPVVPLAGEWCVLSGLFGKNYWHFTYEFLDRLWILERGGYRGRYLVNRTGFSEELLRLVGVGEERIVWIESLDYETAYRFEKLVCVVLSRDHLKNSAPVLLEMAESIRRHLPPVSRNFPKRIFVRRIGQRKLLIGKKQLSQYGFETIIPEELSVAEQIRFFEQAEIVLCPHGANSTNSLYMRPGSVFIETFSNTYVNPLCLETALRNQVYYLQLTQRLEPIHRTSPDQNADYTIEDTNLRLAVEAAEGLAAVRDRQDGAD